MVQGICHEYFKSDSIHTVRSHIFGHQHLQNISYFVDWMKANINTVKGIYFGKI